MRYFFENAKLLELCTQTLAILPTCFNFVDHIKLILASKALVNFIAPFLCDCDPPLQLVWQRLIYRLLFYITIFLDCEYTFKS